MENSLSLRIMRFMDFKEWINQEYFKWRGDSRKNISDFAEYIGVNQPVMSDWLNGITKKPKSVENVIRLADKLGYEVFEILGIPRPELSLSNSRALLDAASDLSRTIKESGTEYSTEALEKLAIEIYSRHGIKVERID